MNRDHLKFKIGNITVSTVWLPLLTLYETAIFSDCESDVVERYQNYEQAYQGHKNWVNRMYAYQMLFHNKPFQIPTHV